MQKSEIVTVNAASINADRSLRWQRWDVHIDNIDTAQNRFDVTEDQEVVIDRGRFKRLYRTIPLQHLVGIHNIHVYDSDMPLVKNATGEAGTFNITDEGGYKKITYYFVTPAQNDEIRHIRLSYSVIGALCSYRDGDRLIWPALPTTRSFPIDASKVSLTMPIDSPAQLIEGWPYTWKMAQADRTIAWESPQKLDTSGSFEVRIEYPHDRRMIPPPWQHANKPERGLWWIEEFAIVSLESVFGVPYPYTNKGKRRFWWTVAIALVILGLLVGLPLAHTYIGCMQRQGDTLSSCTAYAFGLSGQYTKSGGASSDGAFSGDGGGGYSSIGSGDGGYSNSGGSGGDFGSGGGDFGGGGGDSGGGDGGDAGGD